MSKIQTCHKCDNPTGRCEDDSMLDSNGNPLCESCFEAGSGNQDKSQLDIKDCPVCGSNSFLSRCENDRWQKVYYVCCSRAGCWCEGPFRNDEASAISTWNDRPIYESKRKELEELREAKGLLPVCKVDQELFAANVTCRQQAKLIEYHEKTIADQKREIEDCVEGMAMQSALIKELREELERERIRLAACGVIALSNTADSAKQAREMQEYYWSASAQDVANAVDKQMELRELCGELVRTIELAAERFRGDPCIADNPWLDAAEDCEKAAAKAKERLK